MRACRLDINVAVDYSGVFLTAEDAKRWRERDKKPLADAAHKCTPPEPTPSKHGRTKRS
jgi:hypothetical protein